ncbi:hypothetical protein BT96DRAFT_989418 [Gymnopus androsaceus JB14]|uniref:Galactose oxidase n=1 Tax=Gymnopus androsaceus JB14 TaxID=1447944 RepID=A0A6A4HY92_9AGAR|nr:hypothetical protein BT96DRAFT_989418 [Gymnopus androsaceus JB14]
MSSEFPRYGLALPETAIPNGELYLFGSLTSGDIPSLRVGHASVIVTTDLIVWGGDTDTDDGRVSKMVRLTGSSSTIFGLLILIRAAFPSIFSVDSIIDEDLPPAYTPAPNSYEGGETIEYGPARLFQNASLSPLSQRELIKPTSPERPAQRTGHIYLPNQTVDRNRWTTWPFDLATRKWSELTCIGFIPLPREGHAAALINDGTCLKTWNQLPADALDIAGHAMASFGARVFVLGGESFTPTESEEGKICACLGYERYQVPRH